MLNPLKSHISIVVDTEHRIQAAWQPSPEVDSTCRTALLTPCQASPHRNLDLTHGLNCDRVMTPGRSRRSGCRSKENEPRCDGMSPLGPPPSHCTGIRDATLR